MGKDSLVYNRPASRDIFRAFQHRNYRLFFSGQSVSLVGTWMQQIAMSWMVYRMTNSVFLLGIVGFIGQLPMFFVAPLAGVFADRHNRHRILIVTQALAMLQAAVLSGLVLSGRIAVWQILGLSLFLGVVSAFDIPVRQAFTVDMLDNKRDLGNAIALNSSMVNAARLIGPSLAGIIIAAFGEGTCFFINALSYLAVIFSLLAMRISRRHKPQAAKHILLDLKEGFIYAFKSGPIRGILLLLSLISLMGVSYQILMPAFARDVFAGGPKTLGVLMAMSGLGALAGAFYLAIRKSPRGLGRIIPLASAVFGLGIMAFSFSRLFWFSLLAVCLSGFAMMVQMASSNTLLQTIVSENKRGRVMSFYTMAFIGMSPFGSLLAGSLADKIGPSWTLFLAGSSCVLAAIVFTVNFKTIGSRYNRRNQVSAPLAANLENSR